MSTPTTSKGSSPGIFKKFQACFNGRLLYSVSIIALSQVNFGLEQGVFNNTQAMSDFTRRFGVFNAKKKQYQIETVFLSLMNSLPYCGFVFGLVLGNLLSAKIGRKKCFNIMCFWALLGTTVCITTTHNKWQMAAGRIIATVYIGMELALVPVMQSELVPAAVRGATVSTYQSSLLFGQLFASLICRGTGGLTGSKSWRIPLGLLYVIPTIMLCTVWYIPESPRWLLQRGRKEEAMNNLRLLRQGKYTEDQIKEEYEGFVSTLNATVEKGSFKELFQGTNLKRTLIVIAVNIGLQITGQNFVSVYGAIFIKSLGVVNPFTITSINSGLGILTVILAQVIVDKTGRIPLMTIGVIIQSAGLFTMGGLGTLSSPSFSAKAGIVAMTTIFNVGFCIGWAPLSHVVSAEIPTQRLRDMTYALGSVFNIVIQFTVTFTLPYLLNEPYAGLGSKVGFIFGSTAAAVIFVTLFCIPECSGKTLEQIDALFLEGVPIRKFHKMTPTLVADDLDMEKGKNATHIEAVELK